MENLRIRLTLWIFSIEKCLYAFIPKVHINFKRVTDLSNCIHVPHGKLRNLQYAVDLNNLVQYLQNQYSMKHIFFPGYNQSIPQSSLQNARIIDNKQIPLPCYFSEPFICNVSNT